MEDDLNHPDDATSRMVPLHDAMSDSCPTGDDDSEDAVGCGAGIKITQKIEFGSPEEDHLTPKEEAALEDVQHGNFEKVEYPVEGHPGSGLN